MMIAYVKKKFKKRDLICVVISSKEGSQLQKDLIYRRVPSIEGFSV